MPWETVTLVPGLNTQVTETLLQAGYSSTNLIRFKDGLPQKMGGWTKYYDGIISDTIRDMHVYQDLAGNDRLTLGGEGALQDLTDDSLINITPQQETTNITADFSTTNGDETVTIVDSEIGVTSTYDAITFLTPIAVGGLILHGTYQIGAYLSATSYSIEAASAATSSVSNGGAVPTFTTTNGSEIVTVGLTAHGLSVDDEVVFDLDTTVGGITIGGRYTVKTVPTADTFTITCSNTASSGAGPTSMNSGEASILYHITLGPIPLSAGYGTGTYGTGAYGVGVTSSAASGTDITATDWSLDNWGEIILSSPDGGGLYWWRRGIGYQNSQLVPDAPLYNTAIIVSSDQQVVISLGSTVEAAIGVYHDPLLLRWCNTGDFFTWDSDATYRLSRGSKCIGGLATPYRNLVWTDTDLYSVDYIGAEFEYVPRRIGGNCGLIAKHAHAVLEGNVYWMGSSNFYRLGTDGVSAIPCSCWNAIFQDIDEDYQHFCHAGSNEAFSEIVFFYPSASGAYGYCDKCAKLNVKDGFWDISDIQRNAWSDKTVLSNPIACTDTGIIYKHEDGYDADDAALEASFETGFFTLDEGEHFMAVKKIFPDFLWGVYDGSDDATIEITIRTKDYPGETIIEYGPFSVSKTDKFISKRIRKREISLKVASSDFGTFWKLGRMRFLYARDGKR